jgi:hypothetical protein
MKRLSVAHQLVLAALLLAGVARGCGSSTCAVQGDCASNEVCSFTPGDCSGSGTCKAAPGACQGQGSQACACDGTTTVDVPCGFPGSPAAAKATGPCPIPAGTPCTVPEDCDPRALCAFPVAEGCQAQGICVAPDFACTTDSPPACGCDGQNVGGSCLYGQGNRAAPIQSQGTCAGPDGGGNPEGGATSDGGTD